MSLLTNATLLRYSVFIVYFMSITELLEKVRSQGGRITKTRTAILDFLLNTKEPQSSLGIIDNLKKSNLPVNKTTVYRELNYLEENGFIRELRLIGKATLFELSNEHRHYLVCLKCHQIKTLTANHRLCQQEANVGQQSGFKILDHSLEFYGLCKKCQ